MKKIVLLVLTMAVILGGCGLANNLYVIHNIQSNAQSAYVGNPMIMVKQECKNEVYGTIMGSFEEELIYSGKSGNVITITFREYSNDTARQPFYQTLTYDLSSGNEITFRGMFIEVLEANNSSISFRIKNGDTIQQKMPNGSKIGSCGPAGKQLDPKIF